MKKYLLPSLMLSLNVCAQTFNVSSTPELREALTVASSNGEDDIILLADGLYSTTSDAKGTFTYLSNESNSLTIQGSQADKVILDGEKQHQILQFSPTVKAKLIIENTSFLNGFSSNGGAIYTSYDIEVSGSHFIKNTSETSGGAIYSGEKSDYYNSSIAKITKSIFTENKAGSGGGVYSPRVHIYDSQFIRNSAVQGGGFFSWELGFHVEANSDIIKKSLFDGNVAQSEGGGFFSDGAYTLEIINSDIVNNVSAQGGGFYSRSRKTKINNSRIKKNKATSNGGGFSSGNTIIENSIISENKKSEIDYTPIYSYQCGGGFKADEVTIINSILTKNQSINQSSFCVSGQLKVINTLVIKNSSGIKLLNSTNNHIYNSVFVDNSVDFSFREASNPILNLVNNFINLETIEIPHFESNSLFFAAPLGFVDESNDDYRLLPQSIFVDAGVSNSDIIELPKFDILGNSRIVGGTTDIGPYELAISKPTIKSITHDGSLHTHTIISFDTDIELAHSRSLQSVSYDFLGNGTYTLNSSYTYSKAGTYTINVKVVDSENELSYGSITITVAKLPFSKMTYEQKLKEAIPAEYFHALITEIEKNKQSAIENAKSYVISNPAEFNLVTKEDLNTAVKKATVESQQYVLNNTAEFSLVTIETMNFAVTKATAEAQQYILNHLSEFNLVTTTTMNKAVDKARLDAQDYIMNNLEELDLVTKQDMERSVETALEKGRSMVIENPALFGIKRLQPLTKQHLASLSKGWQMLPISESIDDMSIFSDVKIVWHFDHELQAWSAYSPDIEISNELKSKNINILTKIVGDTGIFIEM